MPQKVTHLLGAIRAYVPSGQAMLKSVLTTARPPAGTMVFSADDKSNPADCGEPRVGILACSDRNFLVVFIYIVVVVVHVFMI